MKPTLPALLCLSVAALHAPAFAQSLPSAPGPEVQTDAEILDAFARMGGPAYHAAGTCRMGADDDSVVDPQTRVRGVQNLNVVDLSVFPILTSGNTYVPVAALAWRAADRIAEQLR